MKAFLKGWKLNSLLTGLALFTPQALFALSNFSANIDSTNLSYSFSYSGSPTYLRVYIDSDSKSTTGYSASGIGIDYLIENGTLYKFSGTSQSNWSFKAVTSSNMVKTSTTVKWQVARSALASPTALKVMGNTSAGDNSAVVTQTLSSTAPVSWTFCANENATCNFSGTQSVRYGANNTYVTKSLTGPVACSNSTFGDPAYGVAKHCDISGALSSPPAPTPTPTPTPPSGSTASVSFPASSSVIQNPERGFFMTTDCRANPVSVAQLQNYKSQYGHTVFNCLWYLREFKNSPLTSTVLSQLQTQMNNMRTAGFKMILRLAYTNTDINDAPLSVVQGHLDQLAPLFRDNVDVIATVQAGIIGQWAEMSTSANYGGANGPFTAQDWANRKAVVDKLLSVIPSSRMVAVRTPEFKIQPYGSTPLSDAEAFNGSARARVSHYNDCFLSSANDWGTYRSQADKDFLKQDSKYLATSGETCAPAAQNDCANALTDMAALHWSLLHEGYNLDVINKWKSQGCFTTIQARLGYRLQLQDATLSTSAQPGGSIAVTLNIVNTGFAALYNERPVQLILRHTSTGAVVRLPLTNANPRRWLPGSTIQVSQNLTLPANLPAGTYAMLLALPDASSSLSTRPEYSIQLANTGIWEPSTGFNNLKTNLIVSP